MTDTLAAGWRHPERHLAHRVDLFTLEALIHTTGSDPRVVALKTGRWPG